MRKVLKLTLVVAVLLLVPWLTSIAYGNSNSASAPAGVRIETAGQAAAPAATIVGNAHGSVAPGDLFYIDATGSPQDIAVSLYITNAPELIHYLRYLILKVTVYSASGDGQWIKSPSRGSPAPENATYLTLQNSPVKFILPGDARYKVSIDSGSFYCLPAGVRGDHELPHFYLTVEPV